MTQRQVVLAALTALPAFAADTYSIDSSHTQSAFAVKHLLISNVRGEFGKTEGKVVLDDADVSKSTVEASIEVASVNTREPKRDEHLRSAEFFDVAKFPTITFKSTKVEKAAGGLTVTGNLTMKGVTKPVVLAVTAPSAVVKDPYGNSKRGLSATAKINRRDFGVSYGPATIIADEVSITLDVELTQVQPKPAKM